MRRTNTRIPSLSSSQSSARFFLLRISSRDRINEKKDIENDGGPLCATPSMARDHINHQHDTLFSLIASTEGQNPEQTSTNRYVNRDVIQYARLSDAVNRSCICIWILIQKRTKLLRCVQNSVHDNDSLENHHNFFPFLL